MAVNQKYNLYIENRLKIVLMSYCSMGIYNMYYFYRNFNVFNNQSELRNIVKSILYPIFCFSLLLKVSTNFKDKKRAKTIAISISMMLAFFSFSGVISTNEIKYLAFCTFLPMTFVNNFLIESNCEARSKDKQKIFVNLTMLEKFIITIGGPYTTYILLLAVGK